MPQGIALLIAIAVGGGLGLLIGWLLARARAPDNPLENELRKQLGQREAELSQTRCELIQAKTGMAMAQAQHLSSENSLSEHRTLHERALAEAKEGQAKSLADLREAFRALSAEALKQTQPEFLRLANETLAKFHETAKGDLSQRQEAIKGLVEPLKLQLESYQRRLQQSETSQAETLGQVRRQLETLAQSSQSLAQETQKFRIVLKSGQARGRWGEETLRRVVEAAGMSAHCDFSEQVKEGESKPDLVVRLPGNRIIIVDAKVPELDFLNALESSDATKRAESLEAHATKLKATIKSLAERDYPSQFPNALDYVVMFLPAESLFSAALEGDHNLIVWAAGKRIMLATPASLIALLRSVSISWQQHSQTENAQKIADAARELFARVVTFTEHFESIRDGLEKASDAFNKATSSFQTRVRPQGERLADLGGGAPGKELPAIHPMESTLRPPLGNS